MKCKNCGAELPEGTTICPYCDAVVEQKINNSAAVPQQQPVNVTPTSPSEEYVPANPFLGKKYRFVSSRGAAGLFRSHRISEIEVGEDRLYINITPKKYNKAPAILFEDITAINHSFTINWYYIIWITVSLIGALAATYSLLLAVLFFWCGSNRKIKIHQRNGIDVVMYCQKKAEAEEFKNDMQQLTKIQ